MQFNRFTHVNDTPAVQNSGILQFSEKRPQSLCNIIIPWSIKYMWSNAAHSLLILTTPNCSLIRGHSGRRRPTDIVRTAPGGVRAVSGRLRAASGRLRTAFSRTGWTCCISYQWCFILKVNNSLCLINQIKVFVQPAPAQDFWPLESCHFISILRYLIQLLSLWSFGDCRFRVRISSRVRVSASFIFCILSFPM